MSVRRQARPLLLCRLDLTLLPAGRVLCCSELRERIQPEILELIKQQRLNRLCEGSCFRKLGNRRRQGSVGGAVEKLVSILSIPS